MVSTINKTTRNNLRDFFEQDMKDFLFSDTQITRERFFGDFEYFMSKYKDEEINLSIDEQIEILLFLKEALKDYICINATGTEVGKRYITFSFSTEPCDIEEWEAMLNCIYDTNWENF